MDEKALVDFGASINLMPYKITWRTKTNHNDSLIGWPVIHHPRGIIEDVLVKVDKFIFPVDFVILDLDDKVEVPLILG